MENLAKALVTGGAKRFGADMARKLASLGFDIILHYNKSQKDAHQLSAEIRKNCNVQVFTVQKDLSTPGSGTALMQELTKNAITPDLIIHSASMIAHDDLSNLQNTAAFIQLHAMFLLEIGNFIANHKKKSTIIAITDANLKHTSKYLSYTLSKMLLIDTIKILQHQLTETANVVEIAPSWIIDYDFLPPVSSPPKIKQQTFDEIWTMINSALQNIK